MSAAATVEKLQTVGNVPKVEKIRRPSFASDFVAGGLATIASKTVMAPVERFLPRFPPWFFRRVGFGTPTKPRLLRCRLSCLLTCDLQAILLSSLRVRRFPRRCPNFAAAGMGAAGNDFALLGCITAGRCCWHGCTVSIDEFSHHWMSYETSFYDNDSLARRVKLLLQVQFSHPDIPPEARYNGLLDCVRRVYTEQGIFSFWRGNAVNVFRHIPTQALNFSLKERFRLLYLDGVPIEHFWTYLSLSLLSGASSGALSLAVLYPLDFARTRLAADVRTSGNRQFRGSIDCLRQTYSAEGLRGIYRGFDIAFVGAVTWRALYFGFYDTLTTHLLGGRQGGTLQQRWAVAQIVTSVSGTLVYPIDTVRRRMMMEAGRSERLYTSSFHCAQTILAKEGLRSFFRGLSANLLRGVGTSALLVLYDEIRQFFSRM